MSKALKHLLLGTTSHTVQHSVCYLLYSVAMRMRSVLYFSKISMKADTLNHKTITTKGSCSGLRSVHISRV